MTDTGSCIIYLFPECIVKQLFISEKKLFMEYTQKKIQQKWLYTGMHAIEIKSN